MSSTTPHPNESIVRRFYAAREAGRADEVRRLVADDVRWRDPYPPPYGGQFEGIDEVVGFLFGPLVDEMDDSGLELDEVMANDRTSVAIVNWWCTINGRTMRGREIGVYRIRDGRIADVWFVTENQTSADEFFSRRHRSISEHGGPEGPGYSA